jgi:G3E family GTPase
LREAEIGPYNSRHGAKNLIPVTVLTGYLGAGKTTLVEPHPFRGPWTEIRVIVNEFGEIGIDNELILNTDEELFEMNNGCICCTVRGDLIRTMHGLLSKDRQLRRHRR